MSLKDLSKEEAIALLERIAQGLATTEDAGDFCLWVADVYKQYGLAIDLASGLDYEPGAVSMEDFEEHMFQASLPDSDPRKRD